MSQERTSTNPTFGLRYKPIQDVMFRASYSTGFLPPAVNQLVPSANQTVTAAQAAAFRDPRRGGASISSAFTVEVGGSPDLRPEESISRSAGVVFTPRFVSGLRLSLDWTRIRKTDNIAQFFDNQTAINNELFVPGVVTRGPATSGGVGPITNVSLRLLNFAKQDVEAYDLGGEYTLSTERLGKFTFTTVGSRFMHNEIQTVPAAPVVENAGYSNSAKWKANAGLSWDYRNVGIAWTAQYYSSYRVGTAAAVSALLISNQGSETVPSQTYHDLFATYRFDSPSKLLSDLEVRLGVRNVFDKEPPYDAGNNRGFYSLYGDPRLSTYSLSIRKNF
jgi:outer membrane receptor protein involved in Fe transport